MYSKLNSTRMIAFFTSYRSIAILLSFCLLTNIASALASQGTIDFKKEDTQTQTQSTFKKLLDSLQFQGFASQAFIATSDNDVFGNTDEGGSFGFTELGLNALFRPLPKLQLSAQMLSRRAGKDNTGMPRLDFAFLDYQLYSHETNQFGIRLGRLKNPFGFYNDTRDVPFTRPSILLPQSIYFDRTRNLGLSSDSVQLYGEMSHAKWGDLTVQFQIGSPNVNDSDTRVSLVPGAPGRLSPDVSIVGRALYETPNKRFRFAVSGIWLNIDYKRAQIDPLGRGSIEFSPIFISAQYNTERFTFTSEYALRKFRYTNFNNPGFDSQDFFGESFYFQGEYRFNQKWEALLRYDLLFTDRDDRSGKKFAAATGRPAHSRFARDFTVGLRWNITPQIMARFEYHRINGTGWLSPLDNPNSFDTTKDWNLFAAQLSFRF